MNGAAQASFETASSQCHMACSGSATESCGGGGLMDVYYTGTLTTKAPAAVQTTNLPSSWTYESCISDSINARSLPVQENLSDNDATTCLNYCATNGYTAAGLEYSGQCMCGSPSDVTASAATTSTQCTMTCSGDSNFICGGPGAMNLYYFS